MKFLADHNVYSSTVRLLAGFGFDVLRASEVDLSAADDPVLLDYARQNGMVLITRDRDFGHLVVLGAPTAGVLFLRVEPATLQAVHEELVRVLGLYDETVLSRSFVSIGPGRHRLRRLP